jgi:vanadium chloroperoxidase
MSLPVLPPIPESLPENGEGPRNYDANYIFYWNNVALDLVRLTHTNGGPLTGPPLTARFLGIFHLAMHDAYFGVFPYSTRPNAKSQFKEDFKPYLPESELVVRRPSTLPRTASAAEEAVAGAAITVLTKLFKNPDKKDGGVSKRTSAALSDFIDASVRVYRLANRVILNSLAYIYGVEVARLVLTKLETKASEDGVDPSSYAPHAGEAYWFDDDPTHPSRLQPTDPDDPEDGDKVTRPYHAPYYGRTATIFATTQDIKIADPPLVPSEPPKLTDPPSTRYLKYLESLEDVHRMGGAEELASTKRRPAQTARGLFWAYDGVGLIGTPPRSYNQIIRQIAFDRKTEGGLDSDENTAQFIRLLTLVNVAMADAGIFSWRDKWKYELWRPLTGVRADPTGPVPDGHSRPTWKVLGAPATNSNQGGFKPPFPAYPSGHATFGAAAFQMVRLFYQQRGDMILDDIKLARYPAHEQQNSNGNQNIIAAPKANAYPSTDNLTDGKIKPDHQATTTTTEPDKDTANDRISFTFISDELNGVSRTLSQPYIPSMPIQNQAGDVRTRVPIKYTSLKEAIFSNVMSRIWLGVHWHFDAFAGETVCEPYTKGSAEGKDNNLPLPTDYQQLFKVETDGSTMYKDVKKMDWFAEASKGPRSGSGPNEKFPVGGVPLGMMIADNIFGNKMRSTGVLTDLRKF